jgi:hypothetical protein
MIPFRRRMPRIVRPRQQRNGQRGRNCTCGPPVPGRTCCCYTTRCGGPEGICTLNPPADNGALYALSYGSEMVAGPKLRRKLVGSAGNTPVRHFQFCFATPDLQSGNWIASQIGSGSGSYTHLNEFMRLISVRWSSFPQKEMVESAGNAPASTCLQGKCIACLPQPHEGNK